MLLRRANSSYHSLDLVQDLGSRDGLSGLVVLDEAGLLIDSLTEMTIPSQDIRLRAAFGSSSWRVWPAGYEYGCPS